MTLKVRSIYPLVLSILTRSFYVVRTAATISVEHLLEALIDTHSTSPTFREVFRSNAITQSFIDAYKMYSTSIAYAQEIDQSTIRVLEKLSHLGLSIALDNSVAVNQKQEVRIYRAAIAPSPYLTYA